MHNDSITIKDILPEVVANVNTDDRPINISNEAGKQITSDLKDDCTITDIDISSVPNKAGSGPQGFGASPPVQVRQGGK